MNTLNNVELSKLLFELDPANTSCIENNLADEYDLFAKSFCISFDSIDKLPIYFKQYFSTELTDALFTNIKNLYEQRQGKSRLK